MRRDERRVWPEKVVNRMCPCSSNDPTYVIAFLGLAVALGAYAGLRSLLKGWNPFVHALVPTGVAIVLAGGVWYAGNSLAAGNACTAFDAGAGFSVGSVTPSAATRPAEREIGANLAEADSVTVRVGPEVKLIAYYFHRTMRCPACLSIEEQAREAIEASYPDELASGRLEWRAVNVEEPGNEHFESDFGLASSALVLVVMRGDEVEKWASLDRVWELVDDPWGFQEYVWSEVAGYLTE